MIWLMTEQHMQLDCAFGLGAGIAEMLLQSHDGAVELSTERGKTYEVFGEAHQ